jgi:hypothetical protein
MATKPVLHRFVPLCENGGSQEWRGTYPVPSNLIKPWSSSSLASNAAHQQEFQNAMNTLIPQYQTDCDSKIHQNNLTCMTCGERATASAPMPMSQLSAPEPYIVVNVLPTCSQKQCKKEALKMMADIIQEDMSPENLQKTACQVCGVLADNMACGRCKSVLYCGKDHQKQDWKVHKKVCAQMAQIQAG